MLKRLALYLILPALALYTHAENDNWQLIATYLLSVNVLVYLLYLYDKKQATRQGWRIPETSLQLFALFGGWASAFLAQRQLHHKTAKTSFQFAFWGIGLLHQYLALEFISEWRITKAVISLL